MKLYAAWFIRLNQLRTVLMLVCVGKFLMSVMHLSVGWIPFMVIWNPANSGENTIPFW